MIGISRKYMDFLTSEAAIWTQEGIISQEQADSITSLYEIREHSMRRILLIAGGVLIGLGGVSFIAAHWHLFPKLLRVCLIAFGYIASLIAYAFTGRSQTHTGRVFLLQASIIFGAGIYLITRMYNYKLLVSEFLAWWLVELIITSALAKDNWQMYFSQAVSFVYLNWINAIDIFALEFMSSSKIDITEFFTPFEGFAALIALWLVRRWIHDRAAFNVNMMLTLLVLASRMSLCLGGTWTLIILAAAGAGLSFSKFTDAEILGILVAGLCGLILTWPEVWREGLAEWGSVLAIVSAVVSACVMLVNIYRGHGAIGVTFCALLIMRYFFDRLFGYMPKAWGFTLLGILFLTAGIFFGKLKEYITNRSL